MNPRPRTIVLLLLLIATLPVQAVEPVLIERGDAVDFGTADDTSLATEADFGITAEQLLWEGAREGDVDKVRAQLEAGADVDYKGAFGATPLLVGVKEKNFEVIQLLIDRGADVDARTAISWPLKLAIENDDLATARVLVEAGAQLEVADSRGWTALMLAADHGNYDLVELLIEHGALVNEESSGEDPVNPLLIAVDGGYTDIVRLLLENGASTEMKDGTPDAALEYARDQRESLRDIIKLLERPPKSED